MGSHSLSLTGPELPGAGIKDMRYQVRSHSLPLEPKTQYSFWIELSVHGCLTLPEIRRVLHGKLVE